MLLLLVGCVLVLLLYVFIIRHSKYWSNKGVPGPKPLPLIGNIGSSLIGQKHIFEIYADIYNKYEDCPFVGIYRLRQPCLLIRDPELIKNILIKDFNHFLENDVLLDKDLDPLISRNTFVLTGAEWKKARQFMTPNFASGKIKAIFPLAENVSKNLVSYVEKHMNEVLDAKDIFTKYSCDVVALCGFGIEGNSFVDPNAELLILARKFADPNSLLSIKLALSFVLPKLIKMKVVPKSFDDGIIALTEATLKYRKENNIIRNDYFDAISQTPSITTIEIAAHVANLIIDGFEASSTVLTFVLYELATNQECQAKLRKEINEVLKKNSGILSYEAMQDMVYLDACVSETLRIHTTLGHLGKICTEQYTMTSTGNDFRNISITVEKGTSIIIPILGLHRDAKYFPSPNKYIPERFLDKSESFKNVFMPFGSGPRMCLGSRFGLMQVKVGIVSMIRNFEVTLNEKTIHPLKYDPLYFSLFPKGGVWVNCKKIQVNE